LVTESAPRPPEPDEVETGVLAAAAGVDADPPAELLAAGDELELELQPATASAAAASAATA
jgi:hypothetical protein